MDLATAVYGLLIAVALLGAVWFVFVLPSERRDHQRRLDIVRKRIAEREAQQGDGDEDARDAGR